MPGTTTSAPRRARAQQGLTVELIVDSAVTLIEREGAVALSMRRLGAELGVEAMALYHHVAGGREELLRRIADRLLERLRELELGAEWREACRRFAMALRDVAIARPATFRLVGLEPFDTPLSLWPVERLLAVLVGEGFRPGDALAVYRAVASYARGYALGEASGFTVDAERAGPRRRLAALDPEQFPILAGRTRELAALDCQTGFEIGLCALIDGLPDPS